MLGTIKRIAKKGWQTVTGQKSEAQKAAEKQKAQQAAQARLKAQQEAQAKQDAAKQNQNQSMFRVRYPSVNQQATSQVSPKASEK